MGGTEQHLILSVGRSNTASKILSKLGAWAKKGSVSLRLAWATVVNSRMAWKNKQNKQKSHFSFCSPKQWLSASSACHLKLRWLLVQGPCLQSIISGSHLSMLVVSLIPEAKLRRKQGCWASLCPESLRCLVFRCVALRSAEFSRMVTCTCLGN